MWVRHVQPALKRAERFRHDTPAGGVLEPATKEEANAALAILKSLFPGKDQPNEPG